MKVVSALSTDSFAEEEAEDRADDGAQVGVSVSVPVGGFSGSIAVATGSSFFGMQSFKAATSCMSISMVLNISAMAFP